MKIAYKRFSLLRRVARWYSPLAVCKRELRPGCAGDCFRSVTAQRSYFSNLFPRDAKGFNIS